jgi:hypothetical protein
MHQTAENKYNELIEKSDKTHKEMMKQAYHCPAFKSSTSAHPAHKKGLIRLRRSFFGRISEELPCP